jgi:phosphinothricin acetyltransferase
VSVTIRRGRAGDLAALTELYNVYVRETPVTFDIEPYTIETRRPWFDAFGESGRHQLFVAEVASRVVGYACARVFREKRAYDTSVETSVYLERAAQGRGIGTQLYTRLFEAIAVEDVHRAIAGITLPNDPSIALHTRFGFARVGILQEVGRKFDRYWDVLWMERGERGRSSSVPGRGREGQT